MAAVWSEETKFSHWLRIEILATQARVERGDVPRKDFEEIKAKAAFDVERIKDLEEKTRHEVAAFLDNVAETVGDAARHLHYGMTSSDLLDTTLALQLRDASGILLDGLNRLISSAVRLAREHTKTLMAGRTHGMHAEPTTFGLKVTGWAFELDRGRSRLVRARNEVSAGKLSGVVGTYSQLAPEVERFVMEALGMEADPSSTQVVSRDRHAEFASAAGIVAGSIERIATEIRHLARTELGEVEEPFALGEQKGSSAMPHKRNPWRSERLCGLARVVRSSAAPAMENIALWHERDISHSSVERILLPDTCFLLDFMISEITEILDGLVVYPERMRANLELSSGLIFSQRVLLDLVDAGMGRDEAYRIVQEDAMEAHRSGRHLREVLNSDPEVSARLSPEQIANCFDESRYLEHAQQIESRLSSLEST
jgi:adenylosuccinate lyase